MGFTVTTWKSCAAFGLSFGTKSIIPRHQSLIRSSFFVLLSTTNAMASTTSTNPLLSDWKTNPFGLPPFPQIQPSHFRPAFDVALSQHRSEITAIASDPDPPTFENTIAPLDRAGALKDRVSLLFSNLCSSSAPPEIQEVQRIMSGPLSEHRSAVYTTPGLFQRIDAVYRTRHSMDLTPEQIRLVERFHLDFVRAGAKFQPEEQKRYSAIEKRLAELTTAFQQNVMTDESTWTMELKEDDLEGLPDDLRAACRSAAEERGMDGYAVTLSRSLVEPFLAFSSRRDLRKRAWEAWTMRGELDPKRDNVKISREILSLRKVQAEMHGYANFAQFATADTMAGTPAAVMELLERVWVPAREAAGRERGLLEELIKDESEEKKDEENGSDVQIEPWDWRYYAEKVRASKYNLDASEIKPYFSLDRMVEAMFDVANKLFGLKFIPCPDVKAYHPDVQVYKVMEHTDDQDKLIAIFLHDNYARPHKKSGAWMSELRSQTKNHSTENCQTPELTVPIVLNNNNFAKAPKGQPTLLTFDDATTLFHEFGHGLHGMLSDCTYARLGGTSVLRDFVELPSQLYEHWIGEESVLKRHARHCVTGESIPEELLKKMKDAENFNQGFATIEYTASALLDQALHTEAAVPVREDGEDVFVTSDDDGGEKLAPLLNIDILDFERKELDRLGMPQGIIPRHRPAHFQHLFSTSAYAAAYYVYLWAEVLDADGFDAFKEAGDIFDRETARKLRKCIYSAGNSVDPRETYREFRGRDPTVEPMLKKKGLAGTAPV